MSHFREYLAFIIVLYFGSILHGHPDDKLVQGALLANFSLAVGFYLGGSKSGVDMAAANAETVNATARPSDTPAQVEITNTSEKPVPTVEALS